MVEFFDKIPKKYQGSPDFSSGWTNRSVSVSENKLSVHSPGHAQNHIMKDSGSPIRECICKLHIDSTRSYANESCIFILSDYNVSAQYYNRPFIENHNGFGHSYGTDSSGWTDNQLVGDTHTGRPDENPPYIQLSPIPAPTSADILYIYVVKENKAYVGVYSPQCSYGWAEIKTGARYIIFGLAIYQGTRSIRVDNLYYLN